jgi:hypothetical protein
MSTPYESARRLVERVYTDVPQCPICRSMTGYVFSGWINDYIQCKDCRAKWLVDGLTMVLLKAPENFGLSDFEDLIGKSHTIEFWKNLGLPVNPRHRVTPALSIRIDTCPDCGYVNPNVFNFCGKCGASMKQDLQSCANCQELNSPAARFCRRCGSSLTQDDQTRIY